MKIYDNGGITVDRYTIFLNPKTNDCIGSSASPLHPQGVWQHTTGKRGRHLGRRVRYSDLPTEVLRALINEEGK